MSAFIILLLLLSRNNGRTYSCESSCMIPGDWARNTMMSKKEESCECGCSACEQASENSAESDTENGDIWTSYRNTNKTIQK